MPRPEIEPLEKIRTTAFKERTDIIQKVNEIVDAINSGGLETIYVDVESVSENEIRGEMSQQAIDEMWENPTTVRFRINGRESHFIQVLGASFNAPVTEDVLFMGYGELVPGLTPRFWLGKIKRDGEVEIKAINLGEIESLEFYRNQHYDTIGLGDFVLRMTDGAEYWVYLEGVSPVHRYTKVSTDDGVLLNFDWGTDPYNNFIQWLEGFHEDQGFRFNVYHTGIGSNLDIKTFNISRTESWPEGWINFFYIVKDPNGTTADEIKLCRGVFHWNNDLRTIETTTVEIPIGGSSATWGNINGHLEDQSDLNAELVAINDRIESLSLSGRYLALWNCVTGKPTTDPSTLPFTYRSGDFYIISNYDSHVANYMPNGTQYTGAASTTPVTGEPAINDIYKFDGTAWTLIKVTALPTAFATIVGSPYDNVALGEELNKKSNVSDIVDNISSSDTDKPLSANQGKYLNNKINNALEKYVEVTLSVVSGTTDQFTGTLTEVQFNNLRTRNYIIKGTITLPNGVWTLYSTDITIQTQTDGTNTTYRLHGILASGGDSIATFDIKKVTSPSVSYVLNGKMNEYASKDSVDSLEDEITAINTKGRLLGNWNDLTGKAHNQVIEAGFVYAAGDYFIIETLGTTNQLMPYGTSYSETASTVAYSGTETVALGDYWVFAAGAWTLEHAHPFFEDFKNIAGTPVDNPELMDQFGTKVTSFGTDTTVSDKKYPSEKLVYDNFKKVKTITVTPQTVPGVTVVSSECKICGRLVCVSLIISTTVGVNPVDILTGLPEPQMARDLKIYDNVTGVSSWIEIAVGGVLKFSTTGAQTSNIGLSMVYIGE